MVTQNVSGTVLQQVLQLIALHCPAHSIIKRTLKTFKSYFSKIGSALLIKHYICADCIFPLKTKDSVCKKCKKSGLNATFFIELPLLPQLQCLFSKRGFYEDLQFRFKADRKRTPDNVEDIYDGNIYKAEMDSGFLRDPNNVSFMWYSDGIKVFKSSAFSVWPLCLAINELPYKKRSDPDNILLVGLWFGKNKPNPNLFLRPLLKTMKKFETDGHSFKLPDNSDILVKGKVLCGTCDLPAKSKFLQFKQFNGAYGCGQCMQEGGRAVAGKTTVQVYPYTPNVPKRTHVETQRFAQQALEARARDKNASVNGVKGPSLVSKLVPDIIRCTAIDVMHGVFLGVCKMLLNLWFSPSFSNQPWSLHHLQDVVDEKLKKIKPPSYAARAPRSLKDIKFWKASEYKLFLLYYSVPLLHGVMEENYLRHHCKLVSAIALLCQDSIFFAQIRLASDLLKSYVGDFAGLYSIRYVGINVHQLVHLGDVVIDLGPLWVYSCFFLENFNGTLNKLFHGTQHIALQICSAVSMMMQMPTFMRRLPPDSIALQYCAKLTDGSKPLKIADVIDDCTYAVGNYCYERNEIDHSRQVLRQCFNLAAGSFKVFYRLKFKGVVYVSKEYPIQSLRNESSYVKICDDIFNVEITDNVIAIDIKSIISLCFCYDVDNNMFLCSPINRLENE
ncbi:hypothetical protein ONE63_011166 [Megalurothrips usitatus]|uniref:Uncharacterized protein n=1 Tax=Megalurothrips usitatus TaxID=439358 RepID=A0AAV7X3L1_9NEOP|nr:hypothetical protein ONE63_011166 [Megalurothrips usitatus]